MRLSHHSSLSAFVANARSPRRSRPEGTETQRVGQRGDGLARLNRAHSPPGRQDAEQEPHPLPALDHTRRTNCWIPVNRNIAPDQVAHRTDRSIVELQHDQRDDQPGDAGDQPQPPVVGHAGEFSTFLVAQRGRGLVRHRRSPFDRWDTSTSRHNDRHRATPYRTRRVIKRSAGVDQVAPLPRKRAGGGVCSARWAATAAGTPLPGGPAGSRPTARPPRRRAW